MEGTIMNDRVNRWWLGSMGCLLFLFLPLAAFAQSAPAALKGQIITNAAEIKLPDGPTSGGSFASQMRKQDKMTFTPDEDGKYTIYFVAFFSKPTPVEKLGVVVLDEKKEAVGVADVAATKGQVTLASMIIVDSTETPKKPHILRVFYAVNNKPVVLAQKEIILK
jgi:hypothetical protein